MPADSSHAAGAAMLGQTFPLIPPEVELIRLAKFRREGFDGARPLIDDVGAEDMHPFSHVVRVGNWGDELAGKKVPAATGKQEGMVSFEFLQPADHDVIVDFIVGGIDTGKCYYGELLLGGQDPEFVWLAVVTEVLVMQEDIAVAFEKSRMV